MAQSEAQVREQKINDLRVMGIEPYPSQAYSRSHTTLEVETWFSQPEKQLENGQADPEALPLKVCGRITSKRSSGSIIFIDLRDESGKIQLKIEKKIIKATPPCLDFKQTEKLLDEGDYIAVEGIGCRTNRGELSIQVQQLQIISKATIPFPDAYYGINDPEICRRHREMDLAANAESLKKFAMRSRIIHSIRSYLYAAKFYEIETPVLQAIYGGAAARPFITHHNALDVDLYLRIAPELFLKRAICGGFERVFELGRVFRNEGVDSTHNPEFTSLEVYQSYADYFGILEVVEDLICYSAKEIGISNEFDYQGQLINIERRFDYSDKYPTFTGKHWQVKTMVEAVKDETGLDFEQLELGESIASCQKLNIHLSNLEKQSLGYVLYAVFDKIVVPTIVQPTFIIDFPVEVSPLAKAHRSKPGFVERFELFIHGTEYSNGFSELNDPREQRKRFEEQLAQKNAGDEEAHPMDEDFIQALSLGMPNCAGMGIGIDRLVMLLTNTQSIRDAIMFPTMRPIKNS